MNDLENKLKDSKVDYFSKLWEKQSKELSPYQKDKIGILYKFYIQRERFDDVIKTYLKKLSGDMIQNFFQDELDDLKTRGFKSTEPDYTSFFRGIAKIVPDTYSEEDINWLIQNAKDIGLWYMILKLKKNNYSPILSRLISCAVANK